MKLSSRRILCVTLLAYTITTLAHFVDPLLTSVDIEARQALSFPTPTPTPTNARQFQRADEGEDDGLKYTVTYAPNSTCGYLSGSVQIPITCENKGVCLWELEYFRFIACEINEDTGLAHTKCLQRDEALDPNLCDDVCASNTYNLFCTNETEPYCRTYAFPKGVRDYRCASTPATRVSSADFTYNGQDYPVFTTSTFAEVDETSPGPFGSLTTGTESTDTETTATKTTSTETRSVETSSSTSEPTGDDKARSRNTEAIAGGTVGAFVGGMLVLALVLYCRRRWHSRPTKTDPSESLQDTVSHEPSEHQVPPFIHAISPASPPTSPSPSSTRRSMPYPTSPITAPFSPSLPDQLEDAHELGTYNSQQFSFVNSRDGSRFPV
ncbi:hypothetical protein B0J13DRAFT_511690 [Dactylonectria estremocensis]|uniref:Uncharacterized protein n=1 Tax=Dactylonectria estremocensis TaxID=1079267 RepID=A0A9P9DQC8_9HYPO|nr:hypothetical protein B0J13DRAFT_511690 [Dactylonectria estremocensis]